MMDICDYDCFNCRFPDCISNLYLGREQEARELVLARLAAGEQLASPAAEKRTKVKGGSKYDWMKRWRVKMREQERCILCGKPTEVNPKTGKRYTQCPDCKAKNSERNKAWYERKKDELKGKRQAR